MAFVFAKAAASNRPDSEDRAEVVECADTLVVVADGTGGIRGGSTASEAIVDAVRARVTREAFDPRSILVRALRSPRMVRRLHECRHGARKEARGRDDANRPWHNELPRRPDNSRGYRNSHRIHL